MQARFNWGSSEAVVNVQIVSPQQSRLRTERAGRFATRLGSNEPSHKSFLHARGIRFAFEIAMLHQGTYER